jgi:hypothetical protein
MARPKSIKEVECYCALPVKSKTGKGQQGQYCTAREAVAGFFKPEKDGIVRERGLKNAQGRD